MKRRDFLEKIFFSGLSLSGISTLNEGFLLINRSPINKDVMRRRENIDHDWRFHLGDETGAEQPSYHDKNWRTLDLPHDWSIEGSFREDNPSGWHGGYLPGGIGWYRKVITWQPEWKDRKVTIDFDGVYMNSDVWINGHHLGHRPNGFISFRYDLTPWLKEGENRMIVRCRRVLERTLDRCQNGIEIVVHLDGREVTDLDRRAVRLGSRDGEDRRHENQHERQARHERHQ